MGKHDAWKDEAIAMKLAGVSIHEIAIKFGTNRGVVDYVTKGVRSTNNNWSRAPKSGEGKPYSMRYHGSRGYVAGYKKRHAVQFLPGLYDKINSFAKARDMSFSSAVAELAALALSDAKEV